MLSEFKMEIFICYNKFMNEDIHTKNFEIPVIKGGFQNITPEDTSYEPIMTSGAWGTAVPSDQDNLDTNSISEPAQEGS